MRNEIVKLLENEDFVKKIIIMEDAEEVKKSFKESGVEVSDSELDEVGSVMNEIVEILNKMPEEELKSVSGGNKEMRSNNVWGANFIREAVGYKPEQYGDQIIKSNVGVGRFSYGKEIEGVQLLSRKQTTGSGFKDFVGENANEIALGTMVAASTMAIVGGVYGAKKLVSWYKNKR